MPDSSIMDLLDDSSEIQCKLNRIRHREDTFVESRAELLQRVSGSTLHDHPQITVGTATLSKVIRCTLRIDELSHTSDACDEETLSEAVVEASVPSSVVTCQLLQNGQLLIKGFRVSIWVDFDRRQTLPILCAAYQQHFSMAVGYLRCDFPFTC